MYEFFFNNVDGYQPPILHHLSYVTKRANKEHINGEMVVTLCSSSKSRDLASSERTASSCWWKVSMFFTTYAPPNIYRRNFYFISQNLIRDNSYSKHGGNMTKTDTQGERVSCMHIRSSSKWAIMASFFTSSSFR